MKLIHNDYEHKTVPILYNNSYQFMGNHSFCAYNSLPFFITDNIYNIIINIYDNIHNIISNTGYVHHSYSVFNLS